MKQPKPIAVDEWRQQLEKLTAHPLRSDDGRTTLEIRKILGLGETTTRRLIRAAIQHGLMRCAGRRHEPTITGATYPVPVFEIVEARSRK